MSAEEWNKFQKKNKGNYLKQIDRESKRLQVMSLMSIKDFAPYLQRILDLGIRYRAIR